MYTFLKIINHFFGIPVVVYHYIKHINQFKKQLEFLNKYFKVMNPYEFISNINKNCSIPRILLTFDDGYSNFLFNVFPLLLEYRFPAIVFLVVNNIGKAGYLDFDEIQDILNSGLIYIGSHTLTHRFLPKLNQDEQRLEIIESKRTLEERLSTKIDFFSYPWGGFNEAIKKHVEEAGYLCAFTTNQAISKTLKHEDIFAIKRLTVKEKESDMGFFIKVSGVAYLFQRDIKDV